jgi:hypothetical protein
MTCDEDEGSYIVCVRARVRVGDGDESSSNGSLLVKIDKEGRIEGRVGRVVRVGVSKGMEEVELLNNDLTLVDLLGEFEIAASRAITTFGNVICAPPVRL